jgi:hypothetical protein
MRLIQDQTPGRGSHMDLACPSADPRVAFPGLRYDVG